VTSKLLGNPLDGYKQFFYMIDPFYTTQLVRAPKLFEDINIYFGILYFVSILSFIIYAFYLYFTQIPIQTNTMILSSSINPIYVNITISCTIPYQCGTWNYNNILQKSLSYQQVWKNVDISSPCYGKDSIINIPTTSIIQYNIILPVCFSDSPNDGIIFTMPFNTSAAVLVLSLTGSNDVYGTNNNMFTELVINANQWKTAFFSQTKTISTDKSVTYQPYVGDLFYNGHPPSTNTGYSSTLRLRLLQFSYLSTTSMTKDVFSTFGSIGGFASFSVTILGMTRGIIVMLYKSWYEVNDSTSQKGLQANAIQMLFLCITKLFSYKS